MKIISTIVLATIGFMCMSDALALDETSKGTCTWVGPSNGGKWEDAANWSTESTEYTVAELLKTNCTFVISSLADGAAITNNLVNRPICGITFEPASAATITLSGKQSVWRGETTFNLGTGGKIVWKMDHPNNWNSLDGKSKILILGAGTLTLDPPSNMDFYSREIQPCNTTTLELNSYCYFRTTVVQQWNNSTVRLIGDAQVAQMIATQSGCSLDLNGHTLTIIGGENVYLNVADYYAGSISGTGNFKIASSQIYPIAGSLATSGYIALYSSALKFPSGFSFPSTIEPVVHGPGYFDFSDSKTLCGLRGDGVTGGVKMSDNTTLTLAKGPYSSSSFAGRIEGYNVVKRGSDYEQVFTGDNVYTGSTTVAEGTLTLRRPISRRGLVAYWPFDDADDPGRDYGPNKLNLTFSSHNSSVSTQCLGAVEHRPAQDLAGNATDNTGSPRYECWNLTRSNGFPIGNDDFSLSLWAKPRNASGHMYLYRHGRWSADGGQMTLWIQDTKIITCIDNWKTTDSDNSPVYYANDLYDGRWHHFAITYATNHLCVYYDGVLKKAKTTTHKLNIPDNTGAIIGNNDTSGDSSHRYYGGIDEVAIYNRELTAEDIAEEYARNAIPPEDPALELPDPVCRWKFNDSSAPGKDSMGNADLIANPNVSVKPSTMSTVAGCYGAYLYWESSMTLPTTSFPANFPTGSDPFTVSARFLPNSPTENADILHFGEISGTVAAVTNGFRLLYANCPRQLTVYFGGTKHYYTFRDNNSQQAVAWTHAVIVCEPASRRMRLYRDGHLESTFVDLDAKTFVKARDLFVNAQLEEKKSANVCLDDVSIYNTALNPAEVATLSRALKTGSVGQIIPAASPVTVASGATLKVEGEGHRLSSLAGSGTVAIMGASRLNAGNASAFAGTVQGPGILEIAAPVRGTVSSGVALVTNGVFAAASLPLVSTTGHLHIPASGQISFESVPTKKTSYVIAHGATVDVADELSWTTTLKSEKCKTEFLVKDGDFILKVVPRMGFAIFFR